MDYKLDKNKPKNLTAIDCYTMREQGIFYFEGVRLELKNKHHSSFDVVAKGGRTPYGKCFGETFIYHSILFPQSVLRYWYSFYENFCLTTNFIFCSRYIIEVNIYEEIVPKIGESVLLGFEKVPVNQKFYTDNDFVYVW